MNADTATVPQAISDAASEVLSNGLARSALSRELRVDRLLARYAQQQNVSFWINGVEQPAALVFSEYAFLPLIAMVADLDAKELLGVSAGNLGIDFDPQPDALFGASVATRPIVADERSIFAGLIFFNAARKLFGMDRDAQVECVEIFQAYESGDFLAWVESRQKESVYSESGGDSMFASKG